MFWYRQLLLEVRRFAPLAVLLLLVVGLQGLATAFFGFPALFWRLLWLAVITLVILAEPFERRAFWRTRPIPRGGLILGKGLFLALFCWLPPLVVHGGMLWYYGPPAGALPWLVAEAALFETLYFLAVVAIVLVAGTWRRACIVLGALWFALLLSRDFVPWDSWLAPRGVRGATGESLFVLAAFAIPLLLGLIAFQVLRRDPRPSFRGLAVVALVCLAATWVVRAHLPTTTALPWRLDARPLGPQPWAELDALRLREASPGSFEARREPEILGDRYELVAELALDRPLPRGHGLVIRQLRSTLELPSGEAVDSVMAEGEWFCRGRRELLVDAGLTPIDERCRPGIAEVMLARIPSRFREELQKPGARLEAKIQIDLFRGVLERRYQEDEDQPLAAGCFFRREKGGRYSPPRSVIHRRYFPGLFRQHRLPTERAYFFVPGPLASTSSAEILEIPQTGAYSRPPIVFLAPAPHPRDVIHQPGESFLGELPRGEGQTLAEEVELLCEERIYVDRSTIRLELENLRLEAQ